MHASTPGERKRDRKDGEKWLIHQSNSSNLQCRIWWVKGFSLTDELALKCMLRKEERKEERNDTTPTDGISLPTWAYVTPQGADAFLIWPWAFYDLWLSWHRSASCCSCFMTWLSRRAKNILHDFAFWMIQQHEEHSFWKDGIYPISCFEVYDCVSIFLFQPAV